MPRKPPDKKAYKTIKYRFNDIINNCSTYKNQDIFETIFDAVKRVNKITTYSYMLLRLYILKEYELKNAIPKIDLDTIKMSFYAICDKEKKKGKAPTGSNLEIKNTLKNIYLEHISNTFENSENLKPILDYYATTMMTSIENNIKNNFLNYINRFVNAYVKTKYEKELENKNMKKIIYADYKIVKKDLIDNTLKSKPIYHDWINIIKTNIVPSNISEKNTIYDLLKNNTMEFLKYMIYMNLEIEKMGKKQYQCFPLSSSIIPKNIKLDTTALINLFETNVSKKTSDVDTYKLQLWPVLFNMSVINDKAPKKYTFDYMISTDCYSVSLLYLNNNLVEKNKEKKNKMKNARKLTAAKNKLLDTDDKKEFRENNKVKRNTKLIKNIDNNATKINYKTEFPYIDDVNIEELGNKHIYIDPGKRALFTMVDDNGKFLRYNNSEHMNKTKRLKYYKKLVNFKNSKGIVKIEESLKNFNSKTCKSIEFIEYIKNKLNINNMVETHYYNEIYRKYKWYSYINKKRTEDNMINKIINTFGTDNTIIIGDWSIGKQMSNFISTPNIALKRKLREKFKVFNIDEFRTSCLHNKTEEVCGHLYLNYYVKKTNTYYNSQYMHSILTFQMETNRTGCIDRDINGCLNMKKNI